MLFGDDAMQEFVHRLEYSGQPYVVPGNVRGMRAERAWKVREMCAEGV